MLRTLIVLPDGTEIFSGAGSENAIQSATITECVNGSQELTLGSCCSNMIEAQLFAVGGGVSIDAGDEIAVYRVENDGARYRIGLFTTEKPTRPSANTLKITAYDRVSWLDRDLSQWVAGLKGWPYTLYRFATMVCDACGLSLRNTEIQNGGHHVQRFSADGITGRQLMQWVGEICGRFCRATADGEIEFAWYEPLTTHAIGVKPIAGNTKAQYKDGNLIVSSANLMVEDDEGGNVTLAGGLEVSDDGEGNVILTISSSAETIMYYQNGLSFEDYAVRAIEKVQLKQNEEDVGTVYPDGIEGAVNTYIITGNPLLTASSGSDLVPIAQSLYEHLQGVTYTPCKVSIPATLSIRAGNIIQITDKNGRSITAYIMTVVQKGQRSTLECTGSVSRDSSSAVNNKTLKALTGKVLNLRMDVDGLKLENADTAGNVASIKADLAGIETRVTQQEAATETLGSRTTTVEQKAEGLNISVEEIKRDGVSKVKTGAGYTFSDDGLKIRAIGSDIENKINNAGMYVLRSGETMLQADKDGVIATDVKVRNYLVIGDYARIEDYSDGTDHRRTACFWTGG